MPASTQARWPIFDLLAQWARASPPGDADFFAQNNADAQRTRAHLRATPEDLRWLAGRDPGHAELLPHMLGANGLNEGELPPETRDALARTCGRCTDKPHCAEELAQKRAADTYTGFCPNAAAIKALRDDTV